MISQKNKNIIILTSSYPRWTKDNIPSFVADFAKNLSDRVGRLVVVAPHYKNAKKTEELGKVIVKRFVYVRPYRFENIAYGGGGISKINLKSPIYLIKLLSFIVSEFSKLFTQVLKNKSTIINAHWLIPQGFVAVVIGIILKRKTIISIHGSDVFSLNSGWLKKIKRFALKHADIVIANSSATEAACRSLYPERNYLIIPMGVDTLLFKPAKKIAETRPRPLSVLFVGRLSPEKGAIYLCEAIKRMLNDGIDTELNIIGDGIEAESLDNYIEKNKLKNKVKLLGWVHHSELVGYYQQADVFVSPSIIDVNGRREALGLVLAEAASCGLPIIATNSGGTRDIIKDGVNGFLVKSENPQELYDKLKYLSSNSAERKRMGRSSVELVKENFSWDSVINKYLKII